MPPSHAPAEWSGEFLMSSSTVDDLSCTLTPEEQSRHLAQQEATGRKSWKTMKDKGEAVWSPTVEAALLEGLTSYVRPPESPVRRRTSLSKKPSSNRFPYRNRFISGWILRQTGKYRTPKQVGSRLQQLRDTCRREDIRALIVSPSDGDDSGDDSSTSPTSSSTFLPSSSSSSYKKESPGIDLLQGPSSQPLSSTSSLVNIIVTLILDPDASSGMVRAPVTLAGYHDSEPLSTNVYLAPLRTGNGLPSLSSFNSSISFWSPMFPVMVETTFTVYKHTLSQPIGTETARMYTLPTPSGRDGWSYCTDLCPKFWKLISNDPDVGQYIIVQTVIPQSARPPRPVKISYRFVQPSSASSTSALASDPMLTTLHYDYLERQQWQPEPPLLPISNVSYTLATALGQHTIPTSLMESKPSASSTNNHMITVTTHPSPLLTAGVPSTLLTSEYVSHYEASYAIDPLQYRTYQKNI